MLSRLADPLLSALYPQKCYSCGAHVSSHADGPACRECWDATRIFDGSEAVCLKCGALQNAAIGSVASCPNCHDAKYDAAIAAGIYEKAIAATVVKLKRDPVISRRARMIFERLAERIDIEGRPIIIPIPLAKKRLVERGYNQAEVLAEVLAKKTGLEMSPEVLARTRHTQMHRVAMDKKARQRTVVKAFEVVSPRQVEGRNIVLVDDVFTSGSTASACARILKKRGAARVTAATLARAALHF
jgi:ComF family protein